MAKEEPRWFYVGNGQLRYKDINGWTDQYQDIDGPSRSPNVGSRASDSVPRPGTGEAVRSAREPSFFTKLCSAAAHRLIAVLVSLMGSLWRSVAKGYQQASASLSRRSVARDLRTTTTQKIAAQPRLNSPPTWPVPPSPGNESSGTDRSGGRFRRFVLSNLAVLLAASTLVFSGLFAFGTTNVINRIQDQHDYGDSLLYATLVASGSSSVDPLMRDYTINDSVCMVDQRSSWDYQGGPQWTKSLAQCRATQAADDVAFANEKQSRRTQVGFGLATVTGMAMFLLWRWRRAYRKPAELTVRTEVAQAKQPNTHVAGPLDGASQALVDELTQLASLRDRGVLDEGEFLEAKRVAIGRSNR